MKDCLANTPNQGYFKAEFKILGSRALISMFKKTSMIFSIQDQSRTALAGISQILTRWKRTKFMRRSKKGQLNCFSAGWIQFKYLNPLSLKNKQSRQGTFLQYVYLLNLLWQQLILKYITHIPYFPKCWSFGTTCTILIQVFMLTLAVFVYKSIDQQQQLKNEVIKKYTLSDDITFVLFAKQQLKTYFLG